MLKNIILEISKYINYDNFDDRIVMDNSFNYENDYIKVLRIDSSNKWKGVPHYSDMDKQWSILVERKKEFTQLNHFKDLSLILDIAVTPIFKGVHKGNYGIRIYHMAQNPDKTIIKLILDYIFN